jgi:hypothetical protein
VPYIRVAQVKNDKQGAENFVILVAPDELHATITLTGTRVHGPYTEAAARERLAALEISDAEIESLLRHARDSATKP